jgi:uncharacterized delta-60 repeat protein
MKIFYPLLSACFVFFSVDGNIYAQAGSPDLTFSSDGILTTPIGSGSDLAKAVAVQNDGKIVVAGYSHNGGPNTNFAVVRYETDGMLDNSFGTGGLVTTDFFGDDDRCYALGIQSDGKIVVAGLCFNVNDQDFAVIRYNTDGTLDTSFDADGKATLDFGGSNDQVHALAIQGDGKIIVAGFTNINPGWDFAIARFNINGSVDNTFDSDGMVTVNAGGEDYGYAVRIQNDGKIVIAGSSMNNFLADFLLVRLNSDGSLDGTFGNSGKVLTDLGSDYDQCYSLGIQSNGKLVAGGVFHNGSDYDFAVLRYDGNGALDNSFDMDGKVITPIGSEDDIGKSLALQNDGKILMGGFSYVAANGDFASIRLNNDGSLDNTFDSDGKVLTDLGTNADEGEALAVQADGKIVLAGESGTSNTTYDFAVVRYYGSASIGITELVEPLMFPNPFSQQLTLNGTAAGGEINILDLTGKLLLTQSTSAGQTIVNTDFLKPGFYFLKYDEIKGSINFKLFKDR